MIYHLLSILKSNASTILIAILFIIGSIIALGCKIPIKTVMDAYSYDVLIICIIMELFTNLATATGFMQHLGIKIASVSKGKKRLCLILFGIMMFFVSCFLNNITAVMMILPIVFVLLKTLDVDHKYICCFFATLLAISNSGGAASPIGDFPAILIMSSGVTSFLGYLTHAFPLFAITSVALILMWGMQIKKEDDDGAIRQLAIANLKSQYKNLEVQKDVLKILGTIFIAMLIAWSFIPQEKIPPEIIAVLGYVCAMAICSLKKIKIKWDMELKSVLTIASFLFFSQVISQTGILTVIAIYLQNNIQNPKLLIMSIMVIVSLIAGIFSAGPAAAAMMPVMIELCHGPFAAQSDWIAVAYAASICSGSSLFMWSATAGFLLSGKINSAAIEDTHGQTIIWGIRQYFKYGLMNFGAQLSIALLAVMIIL